MALILCSEVFSFGFSKCCKGKNDQATEPPPTIEKYANSINYFLF